MIFAFEVWMGDESIRDWANWTWDRNYAVVVAVGIAVFALGWWFAGARK